MSYPVLAFHGTKEENIHSICNTGFRVPGEANFVHATDTGQQLTFVTLQDSLASNVSPAVFERLYLGPQDI